MDIADKKITDNSKFDLTYKTLKNASKMKYFEPCFKHYLTEHVKSKFAKVPAPEWEIATFLPTASWSKASSQKVFSDSRKMIGN